MTSSTRNHLADPTSSARPVSGLLTTGVLGSAQARWNDYRGTVAADDAIALLGSRSLYEIAGLDRSRWAIVGIDAGLPAATEHVVVYATDRTAEAEESQQSSEELGVTAFHLSPSTHVDQFLHEAFQRLSIRLVSTLASEHDLRVDTHVVLTQAP